MTQKEITNDFQKRIKEANTALDAMCKKHEVKLVVSAILNVQQTGIVPVAKLNWEDTKKYAPDEKKEPNLKEGGSDNTQVDAK